MSCSTFLCGEGGSGEGIVSQHCPLSVIEVQVRTGVCLADAGEPVSHVISEMGWLFS